MKPKLLTAIGITLGALTLSVRADITTSLLGYWTFDEGSGSFAADASGNNNNGTLTNFADVQFTTMWTSDAWLNTGLRFNQNGETTNFVFIPSAPTLNVRKFSLCAWVKLSAAAKDQSQAGIISKGAIGAESYFLDIYNSKFRVRLQRQAGDGVTMAASSSMTPDVNTWYHVVGTFDNSTSPKMHIYVNGVDYGDSGSATYTTVYTNTHEVSIGCRENSTTSGYNRPFKGAIDEVRIYGRGLTTNDVFQLYTNNAPPPAIATQPRNVTCYSNDTAVFSVTVDSRTVMPLSYQWRFNDAEIPGAVANKLTVSNVTSANVGSYRVVVTNLAGSVTSAPAVLTVQSLPAPDTTSGLVGWWKFDDASGSATAADSSASGNAGALNGFTDTTYTNVWGDGIIDGALSFNGDGTGSNLVVVSGMGALDFNASPVFTLSAWVQASLTQSNQAGIIAKGTGAGGEQYCLDINNGNYRFFVRDANGLTFAVPTTGPINGFWQHVVGVVNATNGIMNFYINGALVGSTVAPTSLLANSHEVSIANRQSSTNDYNYPFTGAIDDVRVYSRDLTSADVIALYGAAAFPIITAQFPVTYTNLYTLYTNSSPTFRIATVTGLQPFSYQWYTNGVVDPGGTNSTYQFHNLPLGDITNYCIVTNTFGSATSFVWTATVVPAPAAPYAQSVLRRGPIGYWRLDEPDNGSFNAGVVAHDYVGGNNGVYTNSTLGQTGYGQGLANQYGYYPALDPETSALFGYGWAADSYAGLIRGVDFGAPNGTTTNFTIECWVSGAGAQPSAATIVSKGIRSLNDAWAFGVDTTTARKFRFFVRIADGTVITCTSALAADTSVWHYLVGVLDETDGVVKFYIDGQEAASAPVGTTAGAYNSADSLITIGSAQNNTRTGPYSLQFIGYVNDVAVYNYALSAAQVQSNYFAAGIGPRITQAPPATATVDEPGTLTISAAAYGTPPLAYRWTDQFNSPLMADQTNATLTISNITGDLNGDSFTLTVTNQYGVTYSAPVQLTVISGPPQIIAVNLPQQVEVPLGKSYTYSVSASGTKPFSYQWYDAGSPVAGQTDTSFTAPAPALGSRTISVLVTNSRGSASASSLLTVVAPPTDAYATNILGLQPVGYWPLQETKRPAPVTIETNYGTLGAIGNAYYASTNVTLAQTGALTDGDTSVSTIGGTISYAFVPRKSANLTLQAPITLECWMAPTGGGGTSDVISEGGSGLNSVAGSGDYGGFRMSFGGGSGDGDTLQFFAYTGSGGTYNSSSTNIQTAAGSIIRYLWNHCVATYDGTNVLLYINGQLLASGTTPWAVDTWTPLTIGGGRWQGQAPTRRFTGGLDEVAIYTNVLSEIQITNHYTAGITIGASYFQMITNDSPLLYYRMNAAGYVTPDPASYPSAVNYGSAPANGAYLGGVVPGGLAGPPYSGFGTSSVAAPINGIFSCVDGGSDPAFNPTGTQPFTVVTWFKTYPSDGRVQTLMGHGGSNSWALNLVGTNGTVAWNSGAGSVSSTSILNDGNWHFVAGVYDGSRNYLYVDGALNNSAASSGSIADNPTDDVLLGGDPDYTLVGSSERYFAGAIAQAAFFTNALTLPQIQQLYTAAGAISTTPVNVVYSMAGSQLTLSWPVDHTGWRLLARTNSLTEGANWVGVAGSSATNRVVIPIDPNNGGVFYRLVYP